MRKKKSEFVQNLGIRIRLERLKQGLTLEKLAEMSNIDYTTISSIENAFSSPTVDTVYAFAKSLGVQIQDMFNFNFDKDELLNILRYRK